MSFRITPLTDPAHGAHGRRLAWLESDADSIPVGTAFLRLFDGRQEHLAELTLHVHPVERRKGVGSRLLDTAVAAARDNARRCVSALRAAAKAVEARGAQLHTVVAVDTCDDSIAGFTELVVPGNGTGDGQHYGTGVLPEHRGHGLGRWMKAESIRQARGRHPDLGGLLTDTADGNTHMRHISDSLGYVPTHTTLQYQLDL